MKDSNASEDQQSVSKVAKRKGCIGNWGDCGPAHAWMESRELDGLRHCPAGEVIRYLLFITCHLSFIERCKMEWVPATQIECAVMVALRAWTATASDRGGGRAVPCTELIIKDRGCYFVDPSSPPPIF